MRIESQFHSQMKTFFFLGRAFIFLDHVSLIHSVLLRTALNTTSHLWIYRVSQVSCNIKNRHISAFKSSKQFLKIDLWRSKFALFVRPNFNFDFWIVDGQRNIKWVVTFSRKLSFLQLYLEVADFNRLPFFYKSI